LDAGNYFSFDAGQYSTVILTGGDYYFQKFKIAQTVTFVLQGPVSIIVNGKIHLTKDFAVSNSNTYLIQFYPNEDFEMSETRFSYKNTLYASVFAVGKCKIGRKIRWNGVIYCNENIHIGDEVQFNADGKTPSCPPAPVQAGVGGCTPGTELDCAADKSAANCPNSPSQTGYCISDANGDIICVTNTLCDSAVNCTSDSECVTNLNSTYACIVNNCCGRGVCAQRSICGFKSATKFKAGGGYVHVGDFSAYIQGADDQSGNDQKNGIRITAAIGGVFNINYQYSTLDGAGFDPFEVFVNGARILTVDSDTNGSFSFPVQAGDVIVFQIESTDSRYAPGIVSIQCA